MSSPRPGRAEPQPGLGDELAHVATYLDFYRDTLVERARSLPSAELRVSRVASGWTPLELLSHVAFMERRWFTWGFVGEEVAEPWGDSGGDGGARWFAAEDLDLETVVTMLDEQATRTRAVLAAHAPEAVASRAGRFAGEQPPDLRWICFHVLQEYARHAGHLDIVAEIAGGDTGE